MFISVSFYNLIITILSISILEKILNKKRKNNYNNKTILLLLLFIVYIWIVIEVTDIGKINDILYSITELKISPIQGKINLIVFEYIGIDYLLNIILFIPLGFLIPLIWNNYNFLKTFTIGLFFSILIEFTQLFNYRSTDINDLITNTIGTIIGYIIYKIITLIIKKTNNNNLTSPIIYILLAIITMFLLKYD